MSSYWLVFGGDLTGRWMFSPPVSEEQVLQLVPWATAAIAMSDREWADA